MEISFFMPMCPPTVTHQEKSITVRSGKPIVYEPAELKTARTKLEAHLAQHIPHKAFSGPVRLVTKWLFPITGTHTDGEWKSTKPDTDNLQKMLKDCMTKLHYWKDDALVCSEIIEKFWAEHPGIYIVIRDLEDAYDT